MTDFIKTHIKPTCKLLANVQKFPLFHNTELRMARWLVCNTELDLIDSEELVRQLIADGAFTVK